MLAAVAADGPTRLVRVSLTTPLGFGPIGPTAEQFVQDIEARCWPHGGALVAVDRRADASEHLHGLALLSDAEREVAAWCELTGAANHCQGRKVVTGWARHAEGDSSMLRENLSRPAPSRGVLEYTFKDWPEGQGARDLRRDVYASGPFADAWESFRERGGILAAPDPADASQGPSRARESSRVSGESSREGAVGCAHCGKPLPEKRRADALYCQGRTVRGGSQCRSAAARARAGKTRRT